MPAWRTVLLALAAGLAGIEALTTPPQRSHRAVARPSVRRSAAVSAAGDAPQSLRAAVEEAKSVKRKDREAQAIDRAVASEGFKIILLLRLSPIFPFALSNYFYGLTAVEFGPYLAATLLGFAPGTFLYVYSGEVAAVAAGAAGDDAAYPWYVYAGFLSVGAFVAAKVTEVATRALEESGGIVADGDD